jgi:8-oxo-dGTP diphosphatase
LAVDKRTAHFSKYIQPMPYTPIVGTLGYLLSTDGTEVLLVHRNARADDESFGKWNGLGGKLEPDEDVSAGMIRELREEATIEVTSMILRGTVSWPGFGRNGEDWLGFIFVIDSYTGIVPSRNEEGELHWHPISALFGGTLDFWEGDKHFLPLVFDDDPRQFHGVMPYEGGRPVSWNFSRL